MTRLTADFYDRPVLEVACDLIGCTLLHGGVGGVIVETEAYHQSEPACHAYVGLTPRTSVLFDKPGTAYVYRSYGIHALVNAVCEPEGVAAAVLVRALSPSYGVAEMRMRRERRTPLADAELCSGPGRLTQALGIDLGFNGTSLLAGPVEILAAPTQPPAVLEAPRVGITKATDLPWRFCLDGDPNVSHPRPRRASQRRARVKRRETATGT
jgi:DNA-3-methyladenine glycosylase